MYHATVLALVITYITFLVLIYLTTSLYLDHCSDVLSSHSAPHPFPHKSDLFFCEFLFFGFVFLDSVYK